MISVGADFIYYKEQTEMTLNRKTLTTAIASFAGTLLIGTSSFAAGLLGIVPPPPPPVAGVLSGTGAVPPPAVPSLSHVLATAPLSTANLPSPSLPGLQALPKTPSIEGLPLNAKTLEDTADAAVVIVSTNANEFPSQLSLSGVEPFLLPTAVETVLATGEHSLPGLPGLTTNEVSSAVSLGSDSKKVTATLNPTAGKLIETAGPEITSTASALSSLPKL